MSDAPTTPPEQPARSFGSVADAYDRGRPSYPREAAAWLTGTDPVAVLELGAGTGKLTRHLVDLGHDVHATDPDAAMLAVLHRDLPDVRTSVAAAEELPVADASVDVVVCAQAWHWCDQERALAEAARVLKPGGRLSLVWNRRDERIPWVRRLGRLIGDQDQREDLTDSLVASSAFGFVDDASFRFWQGVDRESIQDLALSRSNIAVLEQEQRAAKLAEVLAFYDDYGRGMDGMQLPYEARCFRSTVVTRRSARPAAGDGADDRTGAEDGAGTGAQERAESRADKHVASPAEDDGATGRDGGGRRDVSDGTDTDMLLIDFR